MTTILNIFAFAPELAHFSQFLPPLLLIYLIESLEIARDCFNRIPSSNCDRRVFFVGGESFDVEGSSAIFVLEKLITYVLIVVFTFAIIGLITSVNSQKVF